MAKKEIKVFIALKNHRTLNVSDFVHLFSEGLYLQGLSQNNVDHRENGHKTPSIGDVKHSVM